MSLEVLKNTLPQLGFLFHTLPCCANTNGGEGGAGAGAKEVVVDFSTN